MEAPVKCFGCLGLPDPHLWWWGPPLLPHKNDHFYKNVNFAMFPVQYNCFVYIFSVVVVQPKTRISQLPGKISQLHIWIRQQLR